MKYYIFENWPVLAKKCPKIKKLGFRKFYANHISGHSFCSNWLKIGPDTPYMIINKVTEAFLKILISSDFVLHIPLVKTMKELDNFILKGVDV